MKGDGAMGSRVSGLADAVLGVVQGAGLSGDTVARYGKCCEAVVEFCGRRGFDTLSSSVIDEFAACQQERARHGEIGHFLAFVDRAGRGSLGAVTVDDVRGFMVEMAPRRPAGIGNVVWSLRF